MIIAIIRLSAIFAATIGSSKGYKRIRFSTGQLGYGYGNWFEGHYCRYVSSNNPCLFKALLFLGAGSVIHAVHTQDIFEMGGLAKRMKTTTWTFLVGSLALAGIFPLAGFWSKDEILVTAMNAGEVFGIPFLGPLFLTLGLLVAFMTSFYMFRLIFVAFYGEEKSPKKAEESPSSMTVPLVILAVFAVFIGFIGTPFTDNGFAAWVFTGTAFAGTKLYGNGLFNFSGIGRIFLAWLVYGKKSISAEKLALRFNTLHTVLYNKYYIDEIYQWFFENVFMKIADACRWFDRTVVDGIADGLQMVLGQQEQG